MTGNELLEKYNAGERDFRGVDLHGMNLRFVDLRGVDLRGANFTGATDRNGMCIWRRTMEREYD